MGHPVDMDHSPEVPSMQLPMSFHIHHCKGLKGLTNIRQNKFQLFSFHVQNLLHNMSLVSFWNIFPNLSNLVSRNIAAELVFVEYIVNLL